MDKIPREERMGIRGDISETDRDLNRDMYPNRRSANRFNLPDDALEGGLGGHLAGFYHHTHVQRKDGFGRASFDEVIDDYTPKDIDGSGKSFFGKGPQGYVRKSERVFEDVCQAFTRSSRLDASFIEVEVIGDEVHLEGFVDSRASKWLAEDLAAEIPGVKHVINRLRIRDVS